MVNLVNPLSIEPCRLPPVTLHPKVKCNWWLVRIARSHNWLPVLYQSSETTRRAAWLNANRSGQSFRPEAGTNFNDRDRARSDQAFVDLRLVRCASTWNWSSIRDLAVPQIIQEISSDHPPEDSRCAECADQQPYGGADEQRSHRRCQCPV